MNLIDGEAVLISADLANLNVTLTSHRVYQESQYVSPFIVTSIMLEDVTSCKMIYTEKILWAVLAALAFVVGGGISVAQQNSVGVIAGGIVALVLFLAFRKSRTQRLVLASSSGSIETDISGADTKPSTDFIHAVQAAKNRRCIWRAELLTP